MKNTILIRLFVLLIGSFLIVPIVFMCGCSPSGGGNGNDPSIEIIPNSLDFDSTLTQLVINITSTDGTESAWNAIDNQSWIDLNPTSGTVSNEIDQVSISINRAGLTTGDHTGTVTIASGSGSEVIPISMTVPVSQTLAVSHTKLLFRTHLTDLSFSITNAGAETLTWSISNNESWLDLSPVSGSSTTEADVIDGVVDRAGLEPGDYVDTVFISSDGGDIGIPVLMTVPELFENGTEYFPMADGDIWYYWWADSAKTIKRVISGDTVILGTVCTKILENTATTEAWTKDANGFYIHLLARNFWFDPPLAIPFDLEEGITYDFSSNMFTKVDDQIYTSVISGGLDFIGYVTDTVPAGIFNDVIELYYQPDDETNYYEYYAPGVGLLDNGDYILDSAYIGGIWYK
ncbi:MAG: BACON domain-containing protein [candidate division Zixibacteria bacterium]|nr:BACON domain-containing protein [candidate division Zixibacteria bacterium]